MFGYAGKVGYVDLGSMEVNSTALPEGFAKTYVGANGFGARLLYDCTHPAIGALDPKSPLIFATGPLTGTAVPCTSRHGVFAKSPLTGTFGASYAGGKFGVRMKQAGFDALFICGKADKPSYLSVSDGSIELKSASELWGLGTIETEKALKKVEGKNASIASIGQAGERLVPYACISNDFGRHAGRGGMGAVMGSKNLKAITVSGSGCIDVKSPEKLKVYVEALLPKLKASAMFKGGVNYTSNNAKKLIACFSCRKHVTAKKGKNTCSIEDPECETLHTHSSKGSVNSVAHSNYLCDDFGLDTISTGATIAFAMELFEKGLITEKEAGFRLLSRNEDAVQKCIGLIAKQEGFGKLLALGVNRMSDAMGAKAKKYAVKYLEQHGEGVRGIELAYAVSTKGAGHLRSVERSGHSGTLSLKKIDQLSPHNKASTMKVMEDLLCIYDSLVMCKFSCGFFTPEELASLLEWTAGFRYSKKTLMLAGERIYNLEKLFNIREGFIKEDGCLPKKFSSSKGGSREEFEKMRGNYYKLRGWDKDGSPTEKKLGELGLKKAQQVVLVA